MEWNCMETILKIMSEKIEQLQDENFMLGIENESLKKENAELKALVKEAFSHEKRS